MISLHGTNYVPTPMLTCVYRYYVEQLLDNFGYHSTNDQHQEYWVPAGSAKRRVGTGQRT